ncbi:hypothetical protein [Natranaerobius thermophilus]|uniref:Uncharacterized protein n=1 Tax=Natranaerobius thermophilus (strain ATCC BAA-1301 / DSM 18059 / JW/NM-WN-LF) TaxID=457570 RepID=B2A0H8_NATTJ|nr:hypothetical protein [Natranaerobius thermophilus]ACB84539.1 hypothetical protein Nther_0955 [Natranaerobius thermophilus JW/NM-WN-LF]
MKLSFHVPFIEADVDIDVKKNQQSAVTHSHLKHKAREKSEHIRNEHEKKFYMYVIES